jgi:hypothetical protein
MNGNKTLLVTCVYNNLYDTIIGGRHGRNIHYQNSLITILNFNQDIVVYTSEEDKKYLLENDFIRNSEKIKFIIFDLFGDRYHSYYQKKIKDLNMVRPDRCNEIMHNKINWMNNHVNDGYDYIYWIDSGLSHGGLFPIKVRGSDSFNDWYKNSLFTPKVIDNLNKISDKIVLLAANQINHVFEGFNSLDFIIQNEIVGKYHIIGGLFGGKKELIPQLHQKYEEILTKMISLDSLLREEQILTLLLNLDVQFFKLLEFTTWHHEDSDMAKYNKPNEKYFYKIFEELNQ